MISHAQSSRVQNMPINLEDLVKLGISTSLLTELAPLVAAHSAASAAVGELSLFHVKRRDPNAEPSPRPAKEEAFPRHEIIARGRPQASDSR
jgi:hypothetical protein